MEKLDDPRTQGFHQPAEWETHQGVWLAWPTHRELWGEKLVAAQREFIAFCQAIHHWSSSSREKKGEDLWILVPNHEAEKAASEALKELSPQFFVIPFGDIWLRDTAPIYLIKKMKNEQESGQRAAVRFRFNGWGGKYVLPHDSSVAQNLMQLDLPGSSRDSKLKCFHFPWTLEGGSVEVDGEGTCLTTKQCLLNSNRQEGVSIEVMEERLKSALGVEKILWLNEGLKNDHTDGHIDTLVRFFAPGKVLCMRSVSPSDPNSTVYEEIKKDLLKMKDAKGRSLEIVEVPSPGAVFDEKQQLMPASYLNFYISNTRVIIPIYGSHYHDDEAVRIIGSCFPDREAVGLNAKAILSGGGAFHCISQQVPQGE